MTLLGPIAVGAGAAAAAAAWSVRGRSSTVWAPSIWRGPAARPAVALTFDDGPSESTPAVLELLAQHCARATFFQIGANARRLPAIARQVSAAGHEIGNHTDTHSRLWLRGPAFIDREVTRAQTELAAIHGAARAPRYFRAPYGVRWPGLSAAQQRHNLMGVMWTAIGRDWSAESPASIAARLNHAARPGAILCLHDGRELAVKPDIESTLAVLRILLPALASSGLSVRTVSEMAGSE